MKKTIISILKFLIFVGIGFGILYLVYRKQNKAYQAQCALDGIPAEECSLIGKVVEDFSQANYFWIGMIVLAFMISNISRSIRWNMLLRTLGATPKLINAFFSVMLGYFANLGFPRMGEVIRGGAMGRYEHIPVEKVMGTIVVDRVIDVISLAIMIGLAFVLQFETLIKALEASMGTGGQGGTDLLQSPVLWGLFIAGLMALALAWFFRNIVLSWNITKKIIKILTGFWEGIQTVRGLRKPWVFVFHSIVIWVMYYLMTYMCFFAFTPTAHLSPLAGLMVFVFGAFGILIPSPGGMGTYHWLIIQALAIYGVSEIEAFSFANICFFSIQLFCNVFFGILALIFLPLINKGYHPTGVTPQNV